MLFFEIYSLDEDLCHNELLYVSKNYYDTIEEANSVAHTFTKVWSEVKENVPIETNIWDVEKEEYVFEEIYLNGVKDGE